MVKWGEHEAAASRKCMPQVHTAQHSIQASNTVMHGSNQYGSNPTQIHLDEWQTDPAALLCYCIGTPHHQLCDFYGLSNKLLCPINHSLVQFSWLWWWWWWQWQQPAAFAMPAWTTSSIFSRPHKVHTTCLFPHTCLGNSRTPSVLRAHTP